MLDDEIVARAATEPVHTEVQVNHLIGTPTCIQSVVWPWGSCLGVVESFEIVFKGYRDHEPGKKGLRLRLR